MAIPIAANTLSTFVWPALLTVVNAYYLRGQINELKQELKADIRELEGDMQKVIRDSKWDMRDIKGDLRRLEDRQIVLDHYHAPLVLQ
ncbi:hypothetical protein MMC16_002937 [Acarospora aff. strigata]|nr:hypothetical protein [Acarospora aff. strigata]